MPPYTQIKRSRESGTGPLEHLDDDHEAENSQAEARDSGHTSANRSQNVSEIHGVGSSMGTAGSHTHEGHESDRAACLQSVSACAQLREFVLEKVHDSSLFEELRRLMA